MSYIVQTTQRAYMTADTPVVLWVRDEAGKADFGGTVEVPAVLSVELVPNGYNLPDYTFEAESTEAGKVTFTIEQTFAERKLKPGLFRFNVKDGNEVVATGLLEMVG